MIQVIERFHTIVSYVAEKDVRPCTVKELSTLLAVSAPTCSNIIRTMCELGWLETSDGIRGYVLGPTLYQLAKGGNYRQDVIDTAGPIIDELCQTINEAVTLVINQNGRRHRLMRVEPKREIVFKSDDRKSKSLYGHTTGLTILAFMPLAQRQKYYKTFGSPVGKSVVKVDSLAAFEAKCEEIREKGYLKAELSWSSEDKVTVLGFPVWLADACTMAIGVEIPSYRFTAKKMKEIKIATQSASSQITASLR